jgi:alkylglycerol monooxygenase
MAQDSWRARSWRDKFYIWIAPPGWRPADVIARFPKPAYDPRHDFTLFDPPRGLALSIYALVQFSALMLANSHFLVNFNFSYFLYILVSLVTLGGVLENRREFVFLETARLAATGIGVLAAGAWFGGVHDSRILVAIAGFAALSLFSLSLIWLRPASPAPATQPDTRPA